ncbi:hypothetical protein ACSZM0_15295 [Aeromonas hydrophila]
MEDKKLIELPITINEEILNYLDIQQLRTSIKSLATLFKMDYQNHFPLNISTIAEALHLIHAGTSLNKLNIVAGFDKHIKEYTNDKDSTYFVTVMADYLYSLTEELELEPSFDKHPKCPDIKIIFDSKPLYIECKNPKKDIVSGLSFEQKPMYDRLSHIIKAFPCNLSITYENPLSTDELTDLAVILAERLESATGEGTIYNRDGIEVGVTNLGGLSSNVGEMDFALILENKYSERNLINIITKNGIAMSFIKKGVSVRKNIERQMKNCSKKVPYSESIVLAIQSEYLTGHIRDNIKMISQLFQPNKFTSISGVLLSNWNYDIDCIIKHNFIYINNPFARNSIKDFDRLFRPDNCSASFSL